MHLWERKIFGDVELDDRLIEQMMKVENVYGLHVCANQNFIRYARKLCDIQKDFDLWYTCVDNYMNMSKKDKCRPSYDNYMKKFMNEEYSRTQYEDYVNKVKKSIKAGYDSGGRVAVFDHFFPKYWVDKGYSEDEANAIVNARKTKALRNSHESQALTGDTHPTRLNYWIKKGYSEEDAIIKVRERQTTFTLEKCIAKLGPVDGYNRWVERQTTWQDTINSKAPEELARITKERTRHSKGSISKQEKLLYSMMNDSRITAQFSVGQYVYDFGCGKNIVEYNGDFWHCNPTLFKEDAKVYKKTAKQIWEYDELKNQSAITNGYNVLVVWESEFIKNKEAVVERCKQFLLS